MDLLRVFRYRKLMRIWISALLVALFAITQSATAFASAPIDRTSSTLTAEDSAEFDTLDRTFSATLHHGDCCERSSDESSFLKSMHCSVDCTTYFVLAIDYAFHTALRLEEIAIAAYSALQPELNNRPPRRD